MMTATDWQTRELESASRERLLVEIGTLQLALAIADERTGVSKLQQKISKLEQQISKLEQKISNLQLDLIAARDFAIGAAAKAGESTTQAKQVLESQVRELQRELQRELLAAKDFAIGEAAQAGEKRAQLIAFEEQLHGARARTAFLSRHINQMHNSTTWKLGRIMMLPARIIKKITSRIA